MALDPSLPTFTEPELIADLDLQYHLRALGLNGLDEYRAWCCERGFSPRIKKHWKERSRERFQAAAVSIKARAAAAHRQKRQPARTLRELLSGALAAEELVEPFSTIATLLGGMPDQAVRDAFAELLLRVADTRLLSRDWAVSWFGRTPGNTWLEGLAALAGFHDAWKRAPAGWSATSHSRRRQFGTLCRHLLAEYPTPAFLDAAWFLGGPAGRRQQGWFIHLATGGSVRTADLPVRLTRKMAHHFLLAPPHYTPEAALRWGQVHGYGGGPRHVEAVLLTHRADAFDDDEFWTTVIEWFVRQGDLTLFGPACVWVACVFDYLRHRRANGLSVCLRGASFADLITQTRAWHRELAGEKQAPYAAWPRSGVGEMTCTQRTPEGEVVLWTITELLNTADLWDEGRTQRHCVAGYQKMCETGSSSIWSLRTQRDGGKPKRRLTIELAPGSRRVLQIRGRGNRPPQEAELHWVRQWVEQEGLVV